MRLHCLIILLFFSGTNLVAQDGLEGIIVERYYISTAEDTSNSVVSGFLEPGSTTYRVYVDLKPGFSFQAAFGSPEHALRISSTKPFYNHLDAGTVNPDILPERELKVDIALLDSWFSVAGAGENHYGVLKEFDDSAYDEYITFNKGYLEGKDKRMGCPLRARDGMRRAEMVPFPTFYQMDSALKMVAAGINGGNIEIRNGAWACLGRGAKGADSLITNIVLIGQFTTAGDFSFELNVLIGAPNGTSQKYVATAPGLGEWVHPQLIFSSKNKKDPRNKKRRGKPTCSSPSTTK